MKNKENRDKLKLEEIPKNSPLRHNPNFIDQQGKYSKNLKSNNSTQRYKTTTKRSHQLRKRKMK
jgi:hypothetical protein